VTAPAAATAALAVGALSLAAPATFTGGIPHNPAHDAGGWVGAPSNRSIVLADGGSGWNPR